MALTDQLKQQVQSTSGSGQRFKIAAIGLMGAAGIVLSPMLANNEGLSLVAYQDVAKVWTICYGETLGVKKGDKATLEQCIAQRTKRSAEFMTKVAALIKPPLYQDTGYNLLAAHTDFAYNIGINAYKTSKTLQLTNVGDFVGGCNAMMNWNGLTVNKMLYNCNRPEFLERINGCKGLVARRKRVVDVCLAGAK